jgi:hypothetical protein
MDIGGGGSGREAGAGAARLFRGLLAPVGRSSVLCPLSSVCHLSSFVLHQSSSVILHPSSVVIVRRLWVLFIIVGCG